VSLPIATASARIRQADDHISSRPALPPNSVTKRRPGFQFPATLLGPAMQIRTWLLQQGLLGGTPLQHQLVICGFPRSGTTLCQLMLEACVDHVGTAGRERRALQIGRYGNRCFPAFVSKRPKDLFLIPEIAKWYQDRSIRVQFLVMHRDPRAILTSRHFSRPTEYYFSPELWLQYYPHWKWAIQRSDVLSLSYEQLVANPRQTQQRILNFTGWRAAHDFSTFHQRVPRRFDGRALNGLRPLETKRLQAWMSAEHYSRIHQLLRQIPEFPRLLIDDGYEPDQQWVRAFSGDCGELPKPNTETAA